MSNYKVVRLSARQDTARVINEFAEQGMRYAGTVPRGEWNELVFKTPTEGDTVGSNPADSRDAAAVWEHACEMERRFQAMNQRIQQDEVSRRRVQSQVDRLLPNEQADLERRALERIGHGLTTKQMVQAMMRHLLLEDLSGEEQEHESGEGG